MADHARERRQTNPPLVSVVIATFNGEKFLPGTIAGILAQTFRDFELIVVDDCSTDHTLDALSAIHDPRLRVIRNERNLGISATLNKGIDLAIGKYVAFQDHDDLSSPDRLERQTRFLQEHPEVAMVGSSCRIIDASGTLVREVLAKCDDADLRWRLLWHNPFFQTTLMVRRDVLLEIGGYSSDPMYRLSEDYDVMSRIAMRHPVANLPQFLGCWREHEHSTSAPESKGKRLLESRKNISLRNVRELWQRLGDQISDETLSGIYDALWSFQYSANDDQFNAPDQIPIAQHLTRLERLFSTTTPNLHQTHRKRAKCYYRWGRHAVALSMRSNGSVASRVMLIANAMRLLWWSVIILAKG
jgi:glycosyltransferase involved in cell wall biosynthesis